jgi:hypothetical protein
MDVTYANYRLARDFACGSMLLHNQVFALFVLYERKKSKHEKLSTALPPILSLSKGRPEMPTA